MFVMSPASHTQPHTLHTGPLCQMNIDGRCSTGLQCWSLGNIRDAQHWPACCNTVKLIRGQSAASIDWSPLIVSGVFCSKCRQLLALPSFLPGFAVAVD